MDRQFKETIRAICRLRKFIIRPSQSNEVHPRIANNTKFFPYLKVIPSYCSFYHTNIICSHMLILVFIFFFWKCIGAIDGTYISACAPKSKLVSYKNRKATITHNIMCACDFDMKFTFVYICLHGLRGYSQ